MNQNSMNSDNSTESDILVDSDLNNNKLQLNCGKVNQISVMVRTPQNNKENTIQAGMDKYTYMYTSISIYIKYIL